MEGDVFEPPRLVIGGLQDFISTMERVVRRTCEMQGNVASVISKGEVCVARDTWSLEAKPFVLIIRDLSRLITTVRRVFPPIVFFRVSIYHRVHFYLVLR